MKNMLFNSLEAKKLLFSIDYTSSFSHQEYSFKQDAIQDVFEIKTSQKHISAESDTFSGLDVWPAEITVPLSVFYANSSLQAIVSYLKDSMNMTYSDIARFLNRDPRTIWVTYNNTKKRISHDVSNDVSQNISNDFSDNVSNKSSGASVFADAAYTSAFASIHIPLNIFLPRNLSVLESLVFYLKKDHDLSFNDISKLLGKNYQTIWTVYRRALIKIENA